MPQGGYTFALAICVVIFAEVTHCAGDEAGYIGRCMLYLVVTTGTVNLPG